MKMNKISGVVDSKRRDGKAIKIGEQWFSVMFSSALDGVNKGDFVEFTFTEKPSPTGDPYRNIKGSVTKSSPPASRPTTGGSVGSSTARSFPIAPLAPERSIIRQNSLGHAVKIVCEMTAYGDPEVAAERAIEIARMFEAYSDGSADAKMVEEEVSKMLASEVS